MVLEEAKVAFVPGEAFGAAGLREVFLRFGRRGPRRRHDEAGEVLRLGRSSHAVLVRPREGAALPVRCLLLPTSL